jgi:hypothetical protein
MTAPDGYTTAELADRFTVHRTTIWFLGDYASFSPTLTMPRA